MAKATKLLPKDTLTKIEIHRSRVGEKEGWAFSVYWNNREYPTLISSLYKTKKTATQKAKEYRERGEFDWYGDAE